jgi:hypothetical protein
MPPPEAVKAGKVAPLSDEDRLTLVRWIDLGCPIDLDHDPKNPDRTGFGWMLDDQRPTLAVSMPKAGLNSPLDVIRVGLHDYGSGLDMTSLSVVADCAVGGIPGGQNLAAHFKPGAPGVQEWKLAKPLSVPRGKLTVSVKDRQGNTTRIERTFSAGK